MQNCPAERSSCWKSLNRFYIKSRQEERKIVRPVWGPYDKKYFSCDTHPLKGQSNEMLYLQFFYFLFGKEFAQIFEFLEINLPGISYPGESVFVKHKIRISRRILNQNRKYFNPLVKLWNKTRGPKFHWIVLLRSWYVLCSFIII